MRPTKRPQSALRYPLNHVLGTEASVRVLRVLMLSDIPIGVSELARLAQLQPSGVARVCAQLEDLGVIESVGRGSRNRQFRRSPRFALSNQLVGLYTGERIWGESVFSSLQSLVRSIAPLPRAAWVEGPVALGTDVPGEAVVVGLLVEPDRVEALREQVWPQLIGIQRERDIVMDLRILTMAELQTADPRRRSELERVELLLGPPPLDLIPTPVLTKTLRPPTAGSHDWLDTRSRALARAIADKLRRDPSILEDARRFVDRRILSASPGERMELEEWRGILTTMSVPKLRRFLVGEDARATRLRQSLPFPNALTEQERDRALKQAGAQ